MSPQNIREALITRAIEVIAAEGLDKTTTKAIVSGTGINEAYIYRQFTNKEELLAKAFDKLDTELFDKCMQHIEVMYMTELDFEFRCRAFFFALWKFLLGNRDKCVAYVRYHYSPYFVRYSLPAHKERYLPLIAKFREAFIEEADVWMVLSHILNVILDFAIKVHNEEMPNSNEYAEHVYRVIYASIEQYFIKTEEQES